VASLSKVRGKRPNGRECGQSILDENDARVMKTKGATHTHHTHTHTHTYTPPYFRCPLWPISCGGATACPLSNAPRHTRQTRFLTPRMHPALLLSSPRAFCPHLTTLTTHARMRKRREGSRRLQSPDAADGRRETNPNQAKGDEEGRRGKEIGSRRLQSPDAADGRRETNPDQAKGGEEGRRREGDWEEPTPVPRRCRWPS